MGKAGQILTLLIVASAALLVESYVVLLYAGDSLSGIQLVISHCAIVSALVGYVWLARRNTLDLRGPLLLAIATFGLGPFGAGGTLFVLALTPQFKSATMFEDWYAAIFPEDEVNTSEELAERIRTSDHTPRHQQSAPPFGDILSGGTFDQKQHVIQTIMLHFKPAFAPSLLLALQDDNNGVRVQAASAIAKIEHDFTTTTMERTKAYTRTPNDPDVILALAEHLDDYAFSGILDREQEKVNRRESIRLYRAYLDLRSDDLAVRISVGRSLLRARDYSEAEAWLQESIRAGHITPKIVLWLIESKYRLRRFAEVRQLVHTHHEMIVADARFPVKVRDALATWLPSNATRHINTLTTES